MAKKSLKTKFVMITCLICIFSLSLVSCISYVTSYRIVRNELNQKAGETVLKNAETINNWFLVQETIMDNIVSNIYYSQNYDSEYINSYLAHQLEHQRSKVFDYYIGLADGSLISGAHWIPPADYNPTKRDWYKEAIRKQGLIYSAPYMDAQTGRMVITLAEPVLNQGQVIGVLAADIMVDEIFELTEKAGGEGDTYAFLLDQNGHFLVHPSRSLQPTPTRLISAKWAMDGRYCPLIQSSISQINSVQLRDYDEAEKYIVTTRIKNSNWVFGQAIPESEYFRPLHKLFLGFIIALFISLALGIMVTLFVTNQLIKPLKQLRKTVLRFADKDFTVRSQLQTEDEIGDLSKSFNEMAAAIEHYNRDLEGMVQDRTAQLQEKNERIMESITYAKLIQESILPDLSEYQGIAYEDHFVIWRPRDVVGGDFYWSKQQDDYLYIALADCTGHGVPGALMTMAVKALLDRIVDAGKAEPPSAILRQLNILLKETLNQNLPDAITNDGADIGLCLIKPKQQEMIYAGSKISLFTCNRNEIFKVKGNRQSIGYKNSRLDYEYTDHAIRLYADQVFYLVSDGFFDQNGQGNRKCFGFTRFEQILQKAKNLPMAKQQELFLEVLNQYMGDEKQRDDITMVGFKI